MNELKFVLDEAQEKALKQYIKGLITETVTTSVEQARGVETLPLYATRKQVMKALHTSAAMVNGWIAEGLPVEDWGVDSPNIRINRDRLKEWLATNKEVTL